MRVRGARILSVREALPQAVAPREVAPLSVWALPPQPYEPLYERPARALAAEVVVICAARHAAQWAQRWAQSVRAAFAGAPYRWGCVVVIDGGTPEEEAEWRAAVSGMRALVLRLARNVGPAAARNIAVANVAPSVCRWILVLDADDVLCQPIQEVIAAAERQRATIAWGRIALREETSGVISPDQYAPRYEGLVDRKRALRDIAEAIENPIPLLGSVIRYTAWQRAGGMDSALWHCADWDFWLRQYLAGARFLPVATEAPCAIYSVREGQMSRQPLNVHHRAQCQEAYNLRRQLAQAKTQPKSAVFFHEFWMTGGAQRVLVDLARYLVKQNCAVKCFSFNEPLDLLMRDEFTRYAQDIEGVSQNSQHFADEANAADIRFTFLVHLVDERLRTTFVHYAGDAETNRRPPPPNVVGIYCSRALKEHLDRFRAVPDGRGVVIPNAVEVFTWRAANARRLVRLALNIEPEAFVFVWAGRLVHVKNPAMFLRAALKLVGDFGVYDKPVYFVMAGPPYSQDIFAEVSALAAQPPLAGRVRFLGAVPPTALPAVYSAADAYVSTSHFEGAGLTTLEALAAGLPVIATNVGGQGEFVRPLGEQYLVAPNDVNRLAELMAGLYFSDAKQLDAISNYNASYAALYDIQLWGLRHWALFSQYLGGEK